MPPLLANADLVLERYGEWIGDVFTGEFGKSLLPPVEDVRGKLARALPVSLQLAAMALARPPRRVARYMSTTLTRNKPQPFSTT